MSRYDDIDFKIPKTWCSFDMEMEQPEGHILQIGIVAFNIDSGAIIDSMRLYVRPPNKEPVSEFIGKLTGITDDQIKTYGKSLFLAYLEVCDFMTKHNCFRDPVCWGGNDGRYLKEQLIKQCGYDELKMGKFCFGSNYFDTKKFYQLYCAKNNLPMRSGMAKSQNKIGIPFKGRVHDALDDAKNNVSIFMKLAEFFKNK